MRETCNGCREASTRSQRIAGLAVSIGRARSAGKWLVRRMLAGVALWLLCVAGAPASQPDEPLLLVLGDSLSAAYGIELSQGWVALLARRLAARDDHWRVVNASVSGETTAGGAARLPALLREHRPRLVVIELGGNDGLRGIDFETTRRHLDAMVGAARASGARVLLVGMRLPPNLGPAFNRRFEQMFTTVAQRHAVPLVPFLLEGVGGVDGLMQADGIHPVAAAQPRLLENVWRYLEPLL